MADQAKQTESVRLAGRKLLITGAASGIGRACAEIALSAGASAVLLDSNADGVCAVAAAAGGHALPVDLSDETATAAAVDEAVRLLGGLDGVINCAGVSSLCPIDQMDSALWNRTLAINLTAPFVICRAALPALREKGGTIVNVASGMGLVPDAANTTAYAASKGGLIALTKALAAELAPSIRANVVCPGLTETPMVAHMINKDEATRAASVARYAMRRPAEPSEIARVILFLTSHDASFVTGATVAADGGRTFH